MFLFLFRGMFNLPIMKKKDSFQIFLTPYYRNWLLQIVFFKFFFQKVIFVVIVGCFFMGFFIGIKNTIVGAVRGPRGGNGNNSGGADIIALEVTDEKDFQVHCI